MSHEDDHEGSHPGETEPAPVAAVVLDVGGDVGALTVFAGPNLEGREIEVSREPDSRRVHAIVRRRQVPGAEVFAAVFPDLVAGSYLVWGDGPAPVGRVSVLAGTVARFEMEGAGDPAPE